MQFSIDISCCVVPCFACRSTGDPLQVAAVSDPSSRRQRPARRRTAAGRGAGGRRPGHRGRPCRHTAQGDARAPPQRQHGLHRRRRRQQRRETGRRRRRERDHIRKSAGRRRRRSGDSASVTISNLYSERTYFRDVSLDHERRLAVLSSGGFVEARTGPRCPRTKFTKIKRVQIGGTDGYRIL